MNVTRKPKKDHCALYHINYFRYKNRCRTEKKGFICLSRPVEGGRAHSMFFKIWVSFSLKKGYYIKRVCYSYFSQKKNFTEIMGIGQSITNKIMESRSECSIRYSVGCGWTCRYGSGSPALSASKIWSVVLVLGLSPQSAHGPLVSLADLFVA